jgi:hypothetical protein
MLASKTTDCINCTTIETLLCDIDCKIFQLSKVLYNNMAYMLNKTVDNEVLIDLMNYKRILEYKNVNLEYAVDYTIEMIASRVKLLTQNCKAVSAGSVGGGVEVPPTVEQILNIYTGPANAYPTDSAGVKILETSQAVTNLVANLTTGTTQTIFVCAIPYNFSILEVIDTGNYNVDITSEYLLIDAFDVADDVGGMHPYKIYAMTTGVTYSPSSNHQITIS